MGAPLSAGLIVSGAGAPLGVVLVDDSEWLVSENETIARLAISASARSMYLVACPGIVKQRLTETLRCKFDHGVLDLLVGSGVEIVPFDTG